MPESRNPYGLTWDDVQHDSACLADVISFDQYLEIVDLLGGSTIYIPTRETIETPERNKRIRAEYNGSNLREVARKYGLSSRGASAIIRGHRKC